MFTCCEQLDELVLKYIPKSLLRSPLPDMIYSNLTYFTRKFFSELV